MECIKNSFVNLCEGYLFDKSELNRKVTIDAVYDRFDDTGRIKAFECNWRAGVENQPHIYWDSDVVKWMEGAANILKKHDSSELVDKIESIIDDIEEKQGSDGYFNIYFTAVEPSKRYTDRNAHELYCAGHLFEAAVAYYDATGRDRLLKNMLITFTRCLLKKNQQLLILRDTRKLSLHLCVYIRQQARKNILSLQNIL